MWRANGERREATRRDALSVRRPTDAGRLERRRGVPLPESVEPYRHADAGELGLGERAQRHSLHSPRQRVSDARREQEVRRARDEESPGARVAVDLGLECQPELRRALKLVDEGAVTEPCDESRRIFDGGSQDVRVVKRDRRQPMILRDADTQGRLAGLPRAFDRDDAGIGQSGGDARGGVPCDEQRIHGTP